MKLVVDWTRCDGHRLCTAVLPEMIGTDDWGYPLVRDPKVPPGLILEARRAVAICPALALRLTD